MLSFRSIIFVLLACVLFFVQGVKAQNVAFGVAQYVIISEKNVQDGSLVSIKSNGYILSKEAYDPFLAAVVSLKPAINFGASSGPTSYPIMTSGTAYALVSGANGPIKKGDFITSSTKPGIGMKAIKSGYVIGIALAASDVANADQTKKIPINVNPKLLTSKPSLGSSFFDIFNLSAIAATEEPLIVIRYVLAALVIILSIVIGFFTFSRAASQGIEALGRNPLASRRIQFGIILNAVVAIVVIAAGILMGLVIVRL